MSGMSSPACAMLSSSVVTHAAQQASMQPWVDMECVQLTPSPTVGWIDTLNFGSHQVVREQQMAAVHKQGVTPPNFCTVSVCTPNKPFRFSAHHESREGDVFFLPANTEFDLHIATGAQTAYVSFPEDEFLRAAQARYPGAWETVGRGIRKIAAADQALLEDIASFCFNAFSIGLARRGALGTEWLRALMLETAIGSVLANSQDQAMRPTSGERMRSYQIGRGARALIIDRLELDELPSVSWLCEAIGVSERGLQYAFREYVGVSPLAYMRICRLNRVRTVLRESCLGETTVTDVAMRFGFLHLGRFAADYRRFFGESPSATLAA